MLQTLLAVFLGVQSVQQAPPPPATTSSVSGVITGVDTGRPVRRVLVSLTNAETNANMGKVATDSQGRFSFTGLPAGRYTLRAAKAGYLEVIYGQKKPGSGRAGTPIQLADAQKLERVALALPRGGVISGTVLDEAGDPAWGVPVRAMKWTTRNGVRELQPVSPQVVTDDRGQYRMGSLMPGDYVICAVPRDEFTMAVAVYDEMKSRMPQLASGPATQQGANAAERQAMISRSLASLGPRPDEPKDALVQICAPGTTQPAAATVISVDVGQERAGNDLQLQIQPISTISGRVTWSGGVVPIGNSSSDTTVWLAETKSPNNTVGGPSGQRLVKATADGAFSFANVIPGSYTLTARADVAQRAADPAAAQPAGPTQTMLLWASVEVSVSGQILSDVVLALQPGVSVDGRVVAEGGVDISRVRMTARQAGPFVGEMPPVIAAVDPDGRFTLRGVVPGRYKISTYQTASTTGAIKSAVIDGVDTLDFPIEIKGDTPISEVVVTLTPQLAEIAGAVYDSSEKPTVGMTVVVFTSDSRFWTPDSRRIQGIRPGSDGRFSVKNLPAGEYRIAVVTDVEPGEWFQPEFLRQLVAASTAVRLADGQKVEQILRVK